MTQVFIVSVLVCLVVAVTTSAHVGDKKDRVMHNELSDEEHYQHDQHNPDYDHEAFLGEDEAEVYDNLDPEESKRRLALIVDKIDGDADGKVSQDELKQWIDYTQKRYITDDVKRQWATHNPKNKPELSWDEYKTLVFGFLDNMTPEELAQDEESDQYAQMMKRDSNRWKLADINGDGSLTVDEFGNFLHPEESEHMKHVVLDETMHDIDLNKDGKISIEEYIGDLYQGEEDDAAEPSWVENEREQFNEFRDKDKDGFMDKEEVRQWISPPDYDHSSAESKHLIQEADEDGDGVLTKDEIISKYDVFVGSQATDFGEALNRHDEF